MKSLVIATALMAVAGSASAQNSVTNWSSDHFDVVGSTPGENPVCSMHSEFEIEGRSDIKFAVLMTGDEVKLALTSYDWSAVDDREYDGFQYYFPESETLYNGGKTFGFVHQYINKGFVTSFDMTFLEHLASEDRLFVARTIEGEEKPTVVADLNLTGSATAVAALRRCKAYVENREAARIRREQRSDYIDKDPFD